jgi:hypothetical protein
MMNLAGGLNTDKLLASPDPDPQLGRPLLLKKKKIAVSFQMTMKANFSGGVVPLVGEERN